MLSARFKQIHLDSFRHWKATTEYAKTKDILHVMKMLGHRNIRNTSIYTQLVDFGSDEHYSATANTVEEARKLIEAGFTYVCDMECSNCSARGNEKPRLIVVNLS